VPFSQGDRMLEAGLELRERAAGSGKRWGRAERLEVGLSQMRACRAWIASLIKATWTDASLLRPG
jgi:hypothetical protein